MKDKTFSEQRRCEHCGNQAPMEIVANYSQVETREIEHGHYRWDEGWIHELLKCPACDRVILRRYFWHEPTFEGNASFEVLFPFERKLPAGMPEKVQRAYEAALNVRSIDSNAFGVLLGRVLELLCQDRAAVGDTLHDQLKDLAGKGEIPSKLVEVAHGVRQLRNYGAHASLGELTDEEIPLLDDLARAIIEYVYTAPHLAEKAKARLNTLKNRSQL